MLKGINPILSPDLLHCLRSMGHGDEIAIVDGNYPALEHARRLIRLDGVGLIPAADAILSILPIDDFTEESLFRSTNGDVVELVHDEITQLCQRHAPTFMVIPLYGDVFYQRVKSAHTIVATSEPRLYANMIIRKGVIYP